MFFDVLTLFPGMFSGPFAESIIKRAMDAGLVRRMDATHAAAIVWSTCHGVISLQLKHDGITPVDWQQVFADATEAVVSGLAP